MLLSHILSFNKEEIIMNITVNEILLQARLAELAREALEAYEVITKAFDNSFGLGKKRFQCYCSYFGDIHRSAYISVDGIWEFHTEYYSSKTFNVTLTPDGILACLIAGENNDVFKNHDFGLTREEIELGHATADFREFVDSCKEKLKKHKEAEEAEEEMQRTKSWDGPTFFPNDGIDN